MSEHICEHGTYIPSLALKDDIQGLLDHLDRIRSSWNGLRHSDDPMERDYMEQLDRVGWDIDDLINPCYTCRTTY